MSTIMLAMDVYGKIAGKMPLTTEQRAKLDGLATTALPVEIPEGTGQRKKPKAIGTGHEDGEDSASKKPT